MKKQLSIFVDESGNVGFNSEGASNFYIVQLVSLYQSSKSNISEHIKHIFEDGELEENSVVRNFRITASDSKIYNV